MLEMIVGAVIAFVGVLIGTAISNLEKKNNNLEKEQ